MASSRPSTSGGMSTSRGNNNFDVNKRMSKDDMFFNGTRRTAIARQTGANDNPMSRDDMYIRSRMAAMSQFHIPVRGSTMTPEHSPEYPVLQEVSIPIRMQTPESMTSGEIPIGMALGSPVHVPPEPSESSRWQAQFPPASPRTEIAIPVESIIVPSEASPAMSGPPGATNSLQRKKTGRRKLFGLFGGGKKNVEPAGVNMALSDQGSPALTRGPKASQPIGGNATPLRTPKTPTRSYTQSDKNPPKHKPIMLRSATLPYNVDDQPPTLGRRPNATLAVPPIPRLEVQIPDTKLERYSVMFSDVLNKGPPRHEPAASLLARRQATLERLKTIDDAVEAQERERRPRRATSPQPQPQPPRPQYLLQQPTAASSPRLSIFPAPPSNRTIPTIETPSTVGRMARSNTSPGRLPSPVQQTFDTRRGPSSIRGTSQHLNLPNPFEMNPPEPRHTPSKLQEPIYPTDTSFHFGPEQSGLILDSPSSMTSQEEIIISQPFKPTLHEPQWQMISPSTASSTVQSMNSLGRRGRSPSTASSSTHITKPSSEFDPAELALQNAVEVSIARQISVSRQQRQLLRPLQTRRGTDGRPAAAVSPGSMSDGRSPIGMTVVKAHSPAKLGSDEPIREVHTSTPTLVQTANSPVLAEHRKSSWVVLESD